MVMSDVARRVHADKQSAFLVSTRGWDWAACVGSRPFRCTSLRRPRLVPYASQKIDSNDTPVGSLAEESKTPTIGVKTTSPQRFFQTFEWRGHLINYQERGSPDGLPVLFIHGFGASIGHWRKNIPALVETDQLHVFAIDLIGLGASAKPGPKDVTYSIELWADLVADFANAFDPLRKWSFIGNSIGSLVSLAAADQLGPERVRCCALMNCAGGMVSFRYSELNLFQRVIYFLFNVILFNNVVGQLLFNYIRDPKNLAEVLKQVYVDESAITDELVQILSSPAFDNGACAVFLSILRGDPGPKPEDLLRRLGWCPILTLWGDKDPWTPLDKGFHPGENFVDYHEGLILEKIVNAGHCIHDEVPNVVNTALVSFLISPRLRA